MSNKKKELPDADKGPAFWEQITVDKFKNGDRIKFMTFVVKSSEKSDLEKMIMDLLIKVTEYKGYSSYYNSNVIDPLIAIDDKQRTHLSASSSPVEVKEPGEGWISVKDRLPCRLQECVFVIKPGKEVHSGHFQSPYEGLPDIIKGLFSTSHSMTYTLYEYDTDNAPTHWMPLPQPPKK